MAKSPSSPRRSAAVCILLSSLLHILAFGLAEYWLFQGQLQPFKVIRRDPPELRPFERRKRLTIQRQRSFLSRSAVKIPPRKLSMTKPGTGELLLEHGITVWDSMRISFIDSIFLEAGMVSPKVGWEKELLQVWRDSLDQLLVASRDTEEELSILNPFELEIEGPLRRRSVAVIDPESGRLVKAYWFFPVYGEYGTFKRYNEALVKLRESLREIQTGFALPQVKTKSPAETTGGEWQPVPLIGEVESRYSFSPRRDRSGQKVKPDPIHGFSQFPFRDVLSFEEMKAYPVLFLCYIDVESTKSLARYLMEGGFSLVNQHQLDLLESEMTQEAGKRVRRIDIWSGHPLMEAYYSIQEYSADPQKKDAPPLQGFMVDGRLVAVALRDDREAMPSRLFRIPDLMNPEYIPFCAFGDKPQLFINAVVYGLIQPGKLQRHFSIR